MKWLTYLVTIVLLLWTGVAASANTSTLAESIMQAESRYEIPHGLLFEMCKTESHLNPRAVGDHGRSIGLCQVQENTVKEVAGGNPYHSTREVYARGATGPTVAAIQTALVGEGYDLVTDGIFGRATDLAVRNYQAAHSSLIVDGIVGPRTWGSLGLGVYPGKSITQALFNEEDNIEWAARILRYRFEQCGHGSWALAIAAYNGGCGNSVVVHTGRVLDDWQGRIVYESQDRFSTTPTDTKVR